MKRNAFAGCILLLISAVGAAAEQPRAETISPVRSLPPGYSTSYGFPWLKKIKADLAYTSGYRGLGVKVAVVDTGVDLSNTRLSKQLLPGASLIAGTTGGQDDNGHGTFVAGLIAGALNSAYTAGLAPDAQIIPVKVLAANGSGTDASVSQGIAYAAAQGARVINLSLGAPGPLSTSGLMSALQAGSLIVAAAGNSGTANPDWPARYAKEAWAAGRIIAVGAVDSNNVIASWSNRAGDTAAWFIVAPGVNLVSSFWKAGAPGSSSALLYSGSGTSFAAPLVSATAADILSKWSYLTSAQVAQILFQTATPLGSGTKAKPDPVYGWGLLNVRAALEPVGALKLPMPNGSSSNFTLTSTGLKASSIVSTKGLAGLTLTGVDSFGRAYSTSASNLITPATPLDAASLFKSMDEQLSLVDAHAGSMHLRSTFSQNVRGDGVDVRMMLTKYSGENLVSVGTSGLASSLFGITENLADLPTQRLLANPFLSLTPNAGFVASGYALGGGASLRVGVLSTKAPEVGTNQLTQLAPSNGVLAEYVAPHARGLLKLGFGSTRESQGYLGVTGTEGFGGNSGRTNHVEASGTYSLSHSTLMAAQVGFGQTQVDGSSSGLMTGGANLQTRSWTVSLAAKDAFVPHDTFVVSVSEPLHVVHGDAALQLPRVSPDTGAVSFDSQRVSLAAAPSYVVALGYSAPVGKVARLRAELHEPVNGGTPVGGLRYTRTF